MIFPLIRSPSQVGISSTLHQGILTMSGGPNYESVAELKMFSMLGVDCVGMSSIPECLTAHHCGNSTTVPSSSDKLMKSSCIGVCLHTTTTTLSYTMFSISAPCNLI